MELSTVEFYFSVIGKTVTIQIPKTCPLCGIGNNPGALEELDKVHSINDCQAS